VASLAMMANGRGFFLYGDEFIVKSSNNTVSSGILQHGNIDLQINLTFDV